MRLKTVRILLICGLALLLSKPCCLAQFKDEAFSQNYGDVDGEQADTTSKIFDVKKYFHALGHKTTMNVATSFEGSLVCVGGMQIYNKDYWKLPIVYGGLMGCMYAITWNNRNYKDYSEAYKDIMNDAAAHPNDPEAWSQTWQVLTSMDPSAAINDSNFKDRLKRQKDYYRRYRDLSIIITAGVYALTLVDAYVDAQLFDFDITPDLSMRVEPVVTPKTSVTPRSYGLNCCLKF